MRIYCNINTLSKFRFKRTFSPPCHVDFPQTFNKLMISRKMESCEDTVRRQKSMNQEVGSCQTWNLPVLGTSQTPEW